MIVIDASVWISDLLRGDAFHSETRVWSEVMARRGTILAMPAHFPVEVVSVLQRTAAFVNVQEAIDTITGDGPFVIYPVSLELGLLTAKAAREPSTRGSDAISLALAAWLDLPLVTWDREQRERGAAFLPYHDAR